MIFGRIGCTDIMFVARQLVEKCREHNDSMPRSAFWNVSELCGIPPTMLCIIMSFHSVMQAEVRIGDATTDITVNNGLGLGCTLVPPLFNF